MKLERMKPGQIVYDVQRRRMGNTLLSTIAVYEVRILEVHISPQGGGSSYALASWNHNRPEKYYRGAAERWKPKPPILIETGMMGQKRRATREEIAAMKTASPSETAREDAPGK